MSARGNRDLPPKPAPTRSLGLDKPERGEISLKKIAISPPSAEAAMCTGRTVVEPVRQFGVTEQTF